MHKGISLNRTVLTFKLRIYAEQVKSYQRLKKKMVLNATLLDTQHYKVKIKGKVE